MCPLSSIYSNVKNMRENHVLKETRPSKHNVSINTNNSGYHFTVLSNEYDHLETDYGWTFDELCFANINALRNAFGKVDDIYISKFLSCYEKLKKEPICY